MRSVALAYVLHDLHKHEALAAGWRRIFPDTLMMLCEWADYIVVMETHFADRIPEEFHHKVRVVDVGPDRFGMSINPELLMFLENVADDWQTRGYAI